MKIAVMGTGMVGHALAGKFVALGHEVMMGSRESGNPKGLEWAAHFRSTCPCGLLCGSGCTFGAVG